MQISINSKNLSVYPYSFHGALTEKTRLYSIYPHDAGGVPPKSGMKREHLGSATSYFRAHKRNKSDFNFY